jgi:transcriptional regulator with XRE-family HTH domain
MTGPERGPLTYRVGAAIHSIRKTQGLTLQALADRITATGHATSINTIWRTEQGTRCITLDDLDRFAQALGLTPTDLLTGEAANLAARTRAEQLRAELAALEATLP